MVTMMRSTAYLAMGSLLCNRQLSAWRCGLTCFGSFVNYAGVCRSQLSLSQFQDKDFSYSFSILSLNFYTHSLILSLNFSLSTISHAHSLILSLSDPYHLYLLFDQTKGTQDQDFSYSFSDSLSTLILSLNSMYSV